VLFLLGLSIICIPRIRQSETTVCIIRSASNNITFAAATYGCYDTQAGPPWTGRQCRIRNHHRRKLFRVHPTGGIPSPIIGHYIIRQVLPDRKGCMHLWIKSIERGVSAFVCNDGLSAVDKHQRRQTCRFPTDVE
jgi:hypothetical protein